LFTVGAVGVCAAGPRLLKTEPWPITQFTFDTRDEATVAAEKLATYLETTTTKSK